MYMYNMITAKQRLYIHNMLLKKPGYRLKLDIDDLTKSRADEVIDQLMSESDKTLVDWGVIVALVKPSEELHESLIVKSVSDPNRIKYRVFGRLTQSDWASFRYESGGEAEEFIDDGVYCNEAIISYIEAPLQAAIDKYEVRIEKLG